MFELWHHRLGHPRKNIMDKFHENAIGVPLLRANTFHICVSYLCSKFHNQPIKQLHVLKTKPDIPKHISSIPIQLPLNTYTIGQHLHMDYGFARGSD